MQPDREHACNKGGLFCACSHFLYASPALQGASASSARVGGMHANASEEVLQNLKPLLAQQAAGQGGAAQQLENAPSDVTDCRAWHIYATCPCCRDCAQAGSAGRRAVAWPVPNKQGAEPGASWQQEGSATAHARAAGLPGRH